MKRSEICRGFSVWVDLWRAVWRATNRKSLDDLTNQFQVLLAGRTRPSAAVGPRFPKVSLDGLGMLQPTIANAVVDEALSAPGMVMLTDRSNQFVVIRAAICIEQSWMTPQEAAFCPAVCAGARPAI